MINLIWGLAAGQPFYAEEKKQEREGVLENPPSNTSEEIVEQDGSSSHQSLFLGKSTTVENRSYLNALTGPKEKEIEASLVDRQVLKERLKIDFDPIWGATAQTNEAFERFQSDLAEYNKENEGKERLKIALGIKKMKVWFGNTPAEMTALSTLRGLEFIQNAFSSLLLNNQGDSVCNSFSPIYFYKASDHGQENYESLSKVDASSIPLCLPDIENFSGDESQLREVFSSLIESNQGVIVAVDGSSTSLFALEGQMAHLASLGVTKVFLQNCCYNTMNQKFEEFFTSKESSPFLDSFLKSGFGSLYPKVNCYDFAKAAVDAGIKLFGLDHLKTLTFPGEVVEPRHVMGSNFSAFQIISITNQREEGKYLVLLMGPERVSYSNGIAGLSELCNVPSLYLQECKEKEKPFFSQRVVNFGSEDKGDASEGKDHFMHVVLGVGSEYELL